MNRITDVTRQDIIDIIKYGIEIPVDPPQIDGETGQLVDSYTIKIPVSGRLSELDFLSRIYDLDTMPSTDPRFKNASGDIWQHTVNNGDWDDFWYFTDRRFHLSNGNDDQYFLKFICEMLHPAVRDEKSDWRQYLEAFNKLLESDGYRLVSVKKISGRDAFEAREIDSVAITHSAGTIYAGMKSIGEGSYARVFRFTDDFYQKDFVIKRARSDLNEKELTRFKREFSEMHGLHSPYIVEVYSYNEERNEYTMELMDFTLEKYISSNNATMPFSTRKGAARSIPAGDVCRLYGYAYRRNLSDFR